jgi:integrase
MPKKFDHRRDGIYERPDRPGFWGSWTDAQGRRRRRQFKVSTLQQAQAALAAERHKVEEEKKFGKPLLTEETFSVFADEFLAYQKRRISSKVVRGKLSRVEYERQCGIVEKHLKPFFGSFRLAAIRRKDVAAYINSRMGEVSDGTIIKEVNVLKRLFNVAMEAEKIAANPAHRAPVPKAPEGRVRYLSPDELGKVLRACPEWLRPIVGLLVSTGSRRGEMLRARWEDVSIPRREIRLRHTKSGKERPALLNDLSMQVLVSMGADAHKHKGPLFPGVTPAQVTVAFIRACEEAGIDDFSLHDLRHHYASILRMNGVDLHTLQKLLGHSDPRMTDRYAHLSQPFLLDAARRLDGVLSLAPAAENEAAEPVSEQGSIVTIASPKSAIKRQ